MEHAVFFTGSGGAQFRRTQSRDEAIRVVEHLRNVEGVEDAKVYALTEVALAFKTVYRVEVQAEDGPPGALPPLPPLPAMPDMTLHAVPAPQVEAPPALEVETPPAPQVEAPPAPQVDAPPAPQVETPHVETPHVEAPVAVAAPPAPAAAPAEPAAEVPVPVAEAPEPVMAAVPSEPYEAASDAPSNGKPRGMGFFSR